jgi:glycosyltransferase involved in cell wall biosynthesis
MVERIKIGIIYQNNENWIGGTYYIQNLVLALKNYIEDDHKPQLTIICKTEAEFKQIKALGYPFLNWQPIENRSITLSIYKRVLNKVAKKISGFDIFPQPLDYTYLDVQVIFPAIIGMKTQKGIKKIYWIPDLQEQILPEFFSIAEIEGRTQSHRLISKSTDSVVFSSWDAHNTFLRFFTNAKAKRHVLQFAVTHPKDYSQLDIENLKKKYQLDMPYFFVANQFWRHKNHFVVLKAIKKLLLQGIDNFLVAFSGKEHDYRNPGYVNDLKAFVIKNGLSNHVRFLGFIDRKDQLRLMSEAISVIQPSLFEGWSTVVEDAKAMDQWILASDLLVHREQLKDNVIFFNSENESELADALKGGLEEGYPKKSINYADSVNQFACGFINIIEKTIG